MAIRTTFILYGSLIAALFVISVNQVKAEDKPPIKKDTPLVIIPPAKEVNPLVKYEYARLQVTEYRVHSGALCYQLYLSGAEGIALIDAADENSLLNASDAYRQLAKEMNWPDHIGTEMEVINQLGALGWELIIERVQPATMFSEKYPGERTTWTFKRIVQE